MATHFMSNAVFDGLHPGWDPRRQILAPFAAMPIRLGSFYEPRLEEHDVFVSNGLVRLEDDGAMFTWEHRGRRGRARWIVGTPRVASPRALNVPLFYWSWPLLTLAPRVHAARERGLSFVASNSGHGALARRRLALAVALAPHYPVHVSAGLIGHLPAGAPVTYHEVPREPFAKHAFLERFTFNLASESERMPGYLSERPVEALIAGAMPIYEGDPHIGQWLARDAYLDAAGLDARSLLERMLAAERAGLPERVAAEREALVVVSYETMMERVRELAERVRAELENALDWHERSRVRRLRREAGKPGERGLEVLRMWAAPFTRTLPGAALRGLIARLRRS